MIGRGTRINEAYGKFYFTIIDFKRATELFADPDFDGDPVQIYEPGSDEDSPVPPDGVDGPVNDEDVGEGDDRSRWNLAAEDAAAESGRRRYVVANVEVRVVAERVQYMDASGKLVMESLKDYTKKAVNREFATLDAFLRKWGDAEKKQAIVDELASEGVFFEALAEEIGMDCDPFDLLCHVAWGMPPLTRKERAEQVRKRNYFTQYGDQVRRVLEALLEKYADEGIGPIEEMQVLNVAPFTQFGTPMEILRAFGGSERYQKAVRELSESLYSA